MRLRPPPPHSSSASSIHGVQVVLVEAPQDAAAAQAAAVTRTFQVTVGGEKDPRGEDAQYHKLVGRDEWGRQCGKVQTPTRNYNSLCFAPVELPVLSCQ